MKRAILLVLASVGAGPACAQTTLRDFCADRPGLSTPACTVDPGHVQVEIGMGDWTLDRQPGSRTDTVLAGDVLARFGIGDSTELRMGWTAYGHVRTRDGRSGAVDRMSGTGDVTIGIKQNLMNPDGSGLSIALLPYLSLPTGGQAIGAGDWSAGLLLPVNYALSDAVTLEFTPEVDAAVDEDGAGRHFAYGGAIGVQRKMGERASVVVEFQATRDSDPAGHRTQALAGLSFAFQPGKQSQLDIGVNAGLDRNAPDAEVYFGVSREF